MNPPGRTRRKTQRADGRWAPRMWLGSNFSGWIRLLGRNRFAVGPRYLYFASVDTLASLLNSALGRAQQAGYGRRIARTEIDRPPVFIVGHWRTGTTLLHELLAADPRHTAPTMYQCFAPNHFLLTEKFFPRWLGFLMPDRRPMVDPARFHDLRYEDPVRDPLGQVKALYAHLALGAFEDARPALEGYLAGIAGYRPNRHALSPGQRAEVARRWAPYFAKYGYAAATQSPARLGQQGSMSCL